MRNCLNPRRTNTYEISETDEQTDLPQKLQKRNTRKHQKPTDSTDAWGRSPLTYLGDGKKCIYKQDESRKKKRSHKTPNNKRR